MGSRLPSSRVRPGPTARTVPSWGRSLAVSGMTIPLLVISSRAVGLTTSRSPRGLSWVAVALTEVVMEAVNLLECDSDVADAGRHGPGRVLCTGAGSAGW